MGSDMVIFVVIIGLLLVAIIVVSVLFWWTSNNNDNDGDNNGNNKENVASKKDIKEPEKESLLEDVEETEIVKEVLIVESVKEDSIEKEPSDVSGIPIEEEIIEAIIPKNILGMLDEKILTVDTIEGNPASFSSEFSSLTDTSDPSKKKKNVPKPKTVNTRSNTKSIKMGPLNKN